MKRNTRATAEPVDPQTVTGVVDFQSVTTDAGTLYEVLLENTNGHRAILRFRAKDQAEAERAVQDAITEGADPARIIGIAVAGAGLGSGDA